MQLLAFTRDPNHKYIILKKSSVDQVTKESCTSFPKGNKPPWLRLMPTKHLTWVSSSCSLPDCTATCCSTFALLTTNCVTPELQTAAESLCTDMDHISQLPALLLRLLWVWASLTSSVPHLSKRSIWKTWNQLSQHFSFQGGIHNIGVFQTHTINICP